MKRLFVLLMLAFVAMSCEQIQDFIDDKGHGLVFLEGEMKAYFPDKGDTKNYKFNADLAWRAEVSADWVEVNPTSGPAGENKIQIKVDKNKSDEKRTGYVDITLSNDKSYRIELEQLASGENLDDIIDHTTPIPNNEIWYTNGSTTEPTYPNNPDAFGVNIVSNTYDAENERWIIKFDGDVTTIGSGAFEFCSSLTSVTIGDSVTTIGDYAFYYCSRLTSLTIPDSVTTIGNGAFCECSSLTSITIPDSVTTIGNNAFHGCSRLTSITIPDSVTTIGVSAFTLCHSLKEFNGKFASEDGRCLIIDGTLTSFAPAGLTEYTIPNSVTTIEYGAFLWCSSLTCVTIGDSVTTIGERAFAGCSSLREFNGKYASDSGRCLIVDGAFNTFANACGVIEYTIPNSVTTIEGWAFCECSSLTSVTIPDGVTTIGWAAFEDCSSLTSVIIPDSVTTIRDSAFLGCCNLTSVIIPDNVTTIGWAAFAGCSRLTSVAIGDSVTTIEGWAFHGCSNLISVTIPYSVTTIGESVFRDCSSLTSVYCNAITPPAGGSYMFSYYENGYKPIGCTIYVPTESVEAYKSAEGWSDYADAIVGYEF